MEELIRKDTHNRLLELEGNLTDIQLAQNSSPIYFSLYSALESRKRKIMSLLVQEHFWENSTKLSSVFARKLPDDGTAWVPDSHHLGDFIEGFSGRVIERLPYLLSLKHTLPEIELVMSTGYGQADRREWYIIGFASDEVREHVSLDMIDGQIRLPECLSQCLRHAHPDQERRHESWKLGAGDDIYVVDVYLCFQ